MDSYLVKLTSKKTIYFLLQLIIFIFCLSYIEYVYLVNILPDKKVRETFDKTACTIEQSNLVSQGSVIKRFRADFLVSYTIGSNTYNEWISGNGLDRSLTTKLESQEALLLQFPVSSSQPCWYDPKSPNRVVLVLRHNWASTFPLALPSIIALIMLYYLGKTLSEFFGFTSVKLKEIKRKRQRNK